MIHKSDISCFRYMGADERETISKWLYWIEPNNKMEESFLKRVLMALENVKYDFFIATIEPSVNENADVFYRKGCKTITDMTYLEWQDSANRFYVDENWHSELATLFEGDLLKAYKVATGYWTMSCVVEEMEYENTITEIYQLYDGFASLKNQYEEMGRRFKSTFDYVDRSLADFNGCGFGVVVLKRN